MTVLMAAMVFSNPGYGELSAAEQACPDTVASPGTMDEQGEPGLTRRPHLSLQLQVIKQVNKV